ncbi:hypothetical protein SCG7109_AF_00120 [Chlamydiales bacterium SCGC AG-110-M15]|nr:hypothetical protein SCG7109_AF_00120 [Chlamydiales bacterium SCGC AG-110-M15]
MVGLWEVRSKLPDGVARVIFISRKEKMFLLCDFIKKTQKTPQKEINLALKRAKNLED